MNVISKVNEMKFFVLEQKKLGKTIGFVPTMGYLHEGHMSLVERSVLENDVTILSIFVNPTQFGQNEDLDKYPRDFENDCLKAEKIGASVVFAPTALGMYPENYSTFVDVVDLSKGLCGAVREGHFKGVTTIVNKLFNICSPDKAYFGQKDFQQAQVIKRMVIDLNINLKIVVCPIVREKDGLAMSSRNVFLSKEERAQATVLSKALSLAQKCVEMGERNTDDLLKTITEIISKQSLAKIQYVEIVDVDMLKEVDKIDTRALLALAVKFGNTRLIDNAVLEAKNVNNNDEIKNS